MRKIDYMDFMTKALYYIADNGYTKNVTREEINNKKDLVRASKSEVDEFIKWCEEKAKEQTGNDYFTNVYLVNYVGNTKGEIETKYLNTICSAINLYYKKQKEQYERENSTSEFVGNVGDKVTITVKEARRLYVNSFGYDILRIVAEDGNIYVLSTTLYDVKPGDVIIATIKDHKEYKGEKQTMLNRARRINSVGDDTVSETLTGAF